MNHATFASSPSLRLSLKRGLARQALSDAGKTAPNLPLLFRMAADLRPNRKGLERLAARIKDRPGVCRVALTKDGKTVTFITRALREVTAQVEGERLFNETGLIYLRSEVGMIGSTLGFRLSAVSFCVHALERLVERSALPLDRPLLPQMDDEARAIFRGWDRSSGIIENEDEFYPAAIPGLWAGGHDELAMETDWNLFNTCGSVPIFSARTFLSPSEMRPTVWLRWKDDPTCRIA
jgi:hypothetical protein